MTADLTAAFNTGIMDPRAVEVLADRDRLLAIHAANGQRAAAAEIGCSVESMVKALRLWGIPTDGRKVAEGGRRRATLLAMVEAEGCASDCPWWDGCLDDDGPCRLMAELGLI